MNLYRPFIMHAVQPSVLFRARAACPTLVPIVAVDNSLLYPSVGCLVINNGGLLGFVIGGFVEHAPAALYLRPAPLLRSDGEGGYKGRRTI